MKRKQILTTLLTSMGVLSTTWAQLPVNETFSYADGSDLAGQGNWLEAANTNAFEIQSGKADSAPTPFTGIDSAVYQSVSSGNAVDDEWSGDIDFTLSRTSTNWANGDILGFGFSLVETNALSNAGNDVYLKVATRFPDDIVISLNDSGVDSLTMDAATAGWEGGSGTDVVTEPLRLNYTMRKTRESGIYRLTCSLQNLTSGSNVVGVASYVSKTNAYDNGGLPYLLMQHDGAAGYDGDANRFDVAVDAVSVALASGVNPVLYPTPVSAASGDKQVALSWDVVVEAESYDVLRDGGVIATITTNTYTDIDAALVNGTEYEYIVRSKATGSSDADSIPVYAIPDAPVTGLMIIDTTFDAADGYIDGDLAGQERWKANPNSVLNAFNVDSTGDGFAIGLGNAAKTNDSSVYWNQISSNGVGATWSGTIAFQVSALNAPKIIRPDGEEIAILSSTTYPVFGWGISSDIANSDFLELHNVSGFGFSDDAVIRAWLGSNGSLKFGLNDRFHGNAGLESYSADDLGWNPVTTDTNEVPDLVTELIECTWSIRKTTSTNNYNATLAITVGSNTFDEAFTFNTSGASDLWAADVAQFAMQHVLPTSTNLVDVHVDSLVMNHAETSDIPNIPPHGVAAVASGGLENTISWNTYGEENSVDLYRSDTDGSNYVHIANIVSGGLYVDAPTTPPLEDLRTYFYVLKANYDGVLPSVYSEQATVRALAFGVAMNCGATDMVSGHVNFTISNTVSNGIRYITGSGAASHDGTLSWIPQSDVDSSKYNTSASAVFCGILQTDGGDINHKQVRNLSPIDKFRLNNNAVVNGSALLWCEEVNNGTVDATGGGVGASMGTGKFTPQHVAIRNNGTWYVSKTSGDAYTISELLDEEWYTLTPAGLGDPLMALSGTPVKGDTLNLNAIDAVGLFSEAASGHTYWEGVQLTQGSTPTPLMQWTDTYGIYNEDAASTNDYDGDGVDNVTEWGLKGNPTNPDSTGATTFRSAQDGSGNFLFITPRLDSEPRPTYEIYADDNLVIAPGFGLQVEGVDYTETSGGEWTTNNWSAGLEAVTNAFPLSDGDVRFFTLKVSE